MKTSGLWRLVMEHEFRIRVLRRSFVLTVLITVGLIGMMVAIPSLAGANRYKVVTVTSAQAVPAQAAVNAKLLHGKIDVTTVPTDTDAKERVRQGKANAAVLGDGTQIFVEHNLPSGLRAYLTTAIASQHLSRVATDHGIATEQLVPPQLKVTALKSGVADADGRRLRAFFLMTLLTTQVLAFGGQSIASGVVEEKSSRIVEILVAGIGARALLLGKMVGIGLFALLQQIATVGLLAAILVPMGKIHLGSEMGALALQAVPWFLLTYALVGTLYAALAATVSRQEDLASRMGVLSLLPMLIAVSGSVELTNSGTHFSAVLSYIPPFSSMLMPERMAGGEVAWASVLAAMAVMAVTTVVVMWAAVRVYTNSVLRYGAKISVIDAFRSSDSSPQLRAEPASRAG